MRKRLITLLLCFVMLFGMAMPALADDEENNQKEDGAIETAASAEPIITEEPTAEPTEEPTTEPTEEPTLQPTVEPTEEPTAEPEETPEITVPPEGLKSVVIIGGDLNVSQKADVYTRFGIKEGDVPELIMTFAEEKSYMEGRVPADKLGSRSISSAYIRIKEKGSGISVQTNNITWVTAEMYISALSTAGVEDADIIVAAPFGVSGTAAMAGIFKAYETMTGEKLTEQAKDVAGDEVIVTGELSDVLGSAEAMQLMTELKKILDEIKGMSDEDLRQAILETAEYVGVTLTEEQILQLMSLLRKMADLDMDPAQLLKQAQNAQKAFEDLAKAGEKTAGFFASIANFFTGIVNWFKKLFGG